MIICFIRSKVASLGLSNVDTLFPCSIDTRHYGIHAREDLVYSYPYRESLTMGNLKIEHTRKLYMSNF